MLPSAIALVLAGAVEILLVLSSAIALEQAGAVPLKRRHQRLVLVQVLARVLPGFWHDPFSRRWRRCIMRWRRGSWVRRRRCWCWDWCPYAAPRIQLNVCTCRIMQTEMHVQMNAPARL